RRAGPLRQCARERRGRRARRERADRARRLRPLAHRRTIVAGSRRRRVQRLRVSHHLPDPKERTALNSAAAGDRKVPTAALRILRCSSALDQVLLARLGRAQHLGAPFGQLARVLRSATRPRRELERVERVTVERPLDRAWVTLARTASMAGHWSPPLRVLDLDTKTPRKEPVAIGRRTYVAIPLSRTNLPDRCDDERGHRASTFLRALARSARCNRAW